MPSSSVLANRISCLGPQNTNQLAFLALTLPQEIAIWTLSLSYSHQCDSKAIECRSWPSSKKRKGKSKGRRPALEEQSVHNQVVPLCSLYTIMSSSSQGAHIRPQLHRNRKAAFEGKKCPKNVYIFSSSPSLMMSYIWPLI